MTETLRHNDVASHLGGIIEKFGQAQHSTIEVTRARHELLIQLSPEELTDVLNVPHQFEQYDRLLLPVNIVAEKQSLAAQELGDSAEAQKFLCISKQAGELLMQSIGTTEEEAKQYMPSQQAANTPVNQAVEDMVVAYTQATDTLEDTRYEILDTLRMFDAAELQDTAVHPDTGEPESDEMLRHYVELTAMRQAKAATEVGDEDGRMSYALAQADASDRIPLHRKYNVTGRVV